MKLSQKISTPFLLLLLSLFVFASLLILRIKKEYLKFNISHTTEHAIDYQQRALSLYFEQRMELIALVTSRTQLRISLYEYQKTKSEKHFTKIKNIITDACNSLDSYRDIIVYDRNGVPIVSATGFDINGGTVYPLQESISLQKKGTRYFLIHRAPLVLNGDTIGVIALAESGDEFLGLIDAEVHTQEGFGGSLLYKNSNDDIMTVYQSNHSIKECNTFSVSSIFSEGVPKDPKRVTCEEGEYLVIATPFNEYNLAILVDINTKKLFADIDLFFLKSIISLLLISGIVIVLIFQITVNVVKPFNDLREGAQEIIEGRYEEFAITVSEIDEVSLLSKALAQMTAELMVQKEDLRDKVETLESEMSKRKEVEQSLRESEDMLHDLFEKSTDWFWEFDKHTNFTFVSPRCKSLLGYEPEELIGRSAFDIIPISEREQVARDFNMSQKERLPFTGLINHNLHKDGHIVIIESSGVPLFDDDGEFQGYRGIDRDITKRVELENQLRQSHKMEAVGTLAGGIAHNFNNILGGIMGYAELIKMRDPNPDTLKMVEEILTAGTRASEMVKKLLMFSRKEQENLQPVAMQSVLEDAIELLRASIPTTVSMETSLFENELVVLGDKTTLFQVVMNLGTNAFHAMEGSVGTLNITLDKISLSESDKISLPEISEASAYAALTVSDTGEGMDKAILPRIFDPFFTTKEVGKGTGMGLSIVRGYIETLGGGITVSSVIGKGTTFKIVLPLSEEVISKPVTIEKTDNSVLAGKRVLLVDDEEMIVKMGTAMLEVLEVDVIGCLSAKEALSIIERGEREDIACIITDFTMPEMTGVALSKELKEKGYTIPVILCSGYSDSLVLDDYIDDGVTALLHKPFKYSELSEGLKRVLF